MKSETTNFVDGFCVELKAKFASRHLLCGDDFTALEEDLSCRLWVLLVLEIIHCVILDVEPTLFPVFDHVASFPQEALLLGV